MPEAAGSMRTRRRDIRLLTTTASIDTIEVFARWLPKGFRTRVEALLGRRIRIETHEHGHRVVINRPELEVLPVLHSLTQDRRFWACTSRVDVAYDFNLATAQDARGTQEWLYEHFAVKWLRPKGKYKHRGGDGSWTGYWARGHRGRRPNIYLKGDSVVRFEFKFNRALAVRRANLDDLSKLPAINPKDIFARNVKLGHMREEKYRIRCMRKAVKADVERARGRRASDFEDRYRSTIAKRVTGFIDRLDGAGDWEKIGTDFLRIPTELTWPALKATGKSEKAGK